MIENCIKQNVSMKKLCVSLVICMVIAAANNRAEAQSFGSSYKTSLGVKGYFGDGSIGGLNLKHFLNSGGAIEASLLFKDGFFALEGIYEWHGNINGARGLQWYVGPGAMLGVFNDRNDDDDLLLAVKGTLGLDYKFTGAPINIAFDVNPTFVLTPNTDFDFNAGLAFRFTF